MYSKFLASCLMLFIGCLAEVTDRQSGAGVVKEQAPTAIRTRELKSWGNGAPALQMDLPAIYDIRLQKAPGSLSLIAVSESGWMAPASRYIGLPWNLPLCPRFDSSKA